MIPLIIIKLLKYIFGYVNIKVESVFIERFINICISKKILIWNINRKNATTLYANIGIKDFKNIKGIARKTKSKIKIEKRKGIPFIINRYKKRKNFLVLFLIIVSIFVILSNYIWNIEINGTETINKNEILTMLEENGIKIGTLKRKIDIDKSINNIRMKSEDIAWIGITVKGTNLIVNIKEAAMAPKIVNENEICNIVADKTGIITKIDVQNGTAAADVGDIVTKGDILISGYIDGKYTDRRYVHAMGNVEAKVWYSKKEKIAYKQSTPKYTGNTEKKYEIYINNFRINFYKTLSKFKNYDTIIENKKLIFFPNFYLPIMITKKTNREYEKITETYTEEQLIRDETDKLSKELFADIGENKDIVDKKINVSKEVDYVEVELIYEVKEMIGISEEIDNL